MSKQRQRVDVTNLTKKKRRVLKKTAESLKKERYPIDIGYIERILKSAVRKTFGNNSVHSIESLLKGDFSSLKESEKKMIEKKINLSRLRIKQTNRIKGFRKRMNIIRPFLGKNIQGIYCGETTPIIDWYLACMRIASDIQVKLDDVYKSSDNTLEKLSRVWKVARNTYLKHGFTKYILNEVENEIFLFLKENEIKISVKEINSFNHGNIFSIPVKKDKGKKMPIRENTIVL